jgi:hypothetical protein
VNGRLARPEPRRRPTEENALCSRLRSGVQSKQADGAEGHRRDSTHGPGNAGAEATWSALRNRRVERLVLDPRANAAGWQCQGCGYLDMGGVLRSCLLCQKASHPLELREEVVWKAQPPGIGALLKFKISRAKSRGVTLPQSPMVNLPNLCYFSLYLWF